MLFLRGGEKNLSASPEQHLHYPEQVFGEVEAASIFPELGPVLLDDQDTSRSCIATAPLPASSTLSPAASACTAISDTQLIPSYYAYIHSCAT